MSNAFKKDLKGHGYFRKTNLGLVSGIALATSLVLSLGISNAYAAETLPTNSSEAVVNGATLNDEGEFVREENVSVKEAELKAKVDEVKAAGVTVEEKPTEVVGKAKTETEETSLKKEAEAKVDEQIKALEEAKVEEANRQAEVEKINKLKETFISTPNKRFLILNHLLSRELENDYGKTKTFTDFKSNMGNVQFLDKDKINLSNPRHFKNISDEPLIETPKTVKTKMAELSNNVPKEYKENIKKEQDAYIIKVRDGETVSYNTTLDQDSYLRKEFGIDTISIEKTYDFGLTKNPDYFDVVTDKMAVESYILSKVIKSANPEDRNPSVTTKYIYKDKNGNAIPFNKLYAKVINDSIFNKQNLLKESDVPLEAFKNPEAVPIRGDYSLLRKIGYKGTATEDGGLTQTFEHYFNNPQHYYNFSANSIYYFRKKNLLNDIDYEKIMKPVSSNYHFVTVIKLTDTGLLQQQFVDEKGNEIAPTITSEKSDKGTTVTVATPPNEITYKGQTYLLQKENIPSSLVIKKGINSVTFRYKLQVVSEKGTPETHEVPAFNGGVSPSDAPVVDIPEYRAPLSMVGNPEVLEVPAFNGGVSPSDAPVVDIPEYRAPLSMVGNPEVLEVPAFNGGVSPSDAPVVDIPEYRAPLSMLGNTEKLDFPKYKSPINGLDESAGQKRQIYTVKEKDLKVKPLEQKQVENQSKVSVKEISKEVELKQNGNTLPNTGTEKNELYQLVGITILSLLGLVTIKSSFKEK